VVGSRSDGGAGTEVSGVVGDVGHPYDLWKGEVCVADLSASTHVDQLALLAAHRLPPRPVREQEAEAEPRKQGNRGKKVDEQDKVKERMYFNGV